MIDWSQYIGTVILPGGLILLFKTARIPNYYYFNKVCRVEPQGITRPAGAPDHVDTTDSGSGWRFQVVINFDTEPSEETKWCHSNFRYRI